ncbi:MAG: hypothetical protein AB1696_23090 [Planctomycetota bacterium]
MADNEIAANASSLPRSDAGFLLRLLQILIAAAVGNVLLAAGAFLMRMDSRLLCLAGLAVVFLGPFVVFIVAAWQMSAPHDARRALWACAPLWMVAPPIASWLCELLYWHLGHTGTVLAFVLVLPALAVIVCWGAMDSMRRAGLWARCRRPVAFIAVTFAVLWLATAFQLAMISLSWNLVPLPKVGADSLPALISRLLTAFLPTTLLLVFLARRVVYLGRRAESY